MDEIPVCVILQALPGLLSGDKARFRDALLTAAKEANPKPSVLVSILELSLRALDVARPDGSVPLDDLVRDPAGALLSKVDTETLRSCFLSGLKGALGGRAEFSPIGLSELLELAAGDITALLEMEGRASERVLGVYEAHGVALTEADADIISRRLPEIMLKVAVFLRDAESNPGASSQTLN